MNLVPAEEFRDGNVPAMMDPLTVAKRAFAALPETVTTCYYRGDSASPESALINLAAGRESGGGAARAHRIRHQRADERGVEEGDGEVAGRGVGTL